MANLCVHYVYIVDGNLAEAFLTEVFINVGINVGVVTPVCLNVLLCWTLHQHAEC